MQVNILSVQLESHVSNPYTTRLKRKAELNKKVLQWGSNHSCACWLFINLNCRLVSWPGQILIAPERLYFRTDFNIKCWDKVDPDTQKRKNSLRGGIKSIVCLTIAFGVSWQTWQMDTSWLKLENLPTRKSACRNLVKLCPNAKHVLLYRTIAPIYSSCQIQCHSDKLVCFILETL